MPARNPGMKVTAEGIETRAQLEQLRAMECEQGQGYFFARPLSSEDAFNLLEGEFNPAPSKADMEPADLSRQTAAA